MATENSVTSEIFLEDGGPGKVISGKVGLDNVITPFHFTYPSHFVGSPCAPQKKSKPEVTVDSDGDLVVERRNGTSHGTIYIEHSFRTTLELVGLQVWRGALLLADWALHFGPALLDGRTVLEVGAGTGLTSIAAAVHAKEVVSTDVDMGGILDLIRANAAANQHLVRAKFTVLGLDFFAESWSPELEPKLKEASVILAADVVYDVDLTEAFVRAMVKILNTKPSKSLYFALEKRYVFTTDDLDSVAPIYEHFLNCLERVRLPHWKVEQVPLDFPQYFRYERVKQLVLWRITS